MQMAAYGLQARPLSFRCPRGQQHTTTAARLDRAGAVAALGSLAASGGVSCALASIRAPLSSTVQTAPWQAHCPVQSPACSLTAQLPAVSSTWRGGYGCQQLLQTRRQQLRSGSRQRRQRGATVQTGAILHVFFQLEANIQIPAPFAPTAGRTDRKLFYVFVARQHRLRHLLDLMHTDALADMFWDLWCIPRPRESWGPCCAERILAALRAC